MSSTRSSVMILLGLNIGMFILQIFIGDGFTQAMLLESRDLLSRPWILVTSMFVHAGFMHLLFNMWALLIFGGFLEQRIGPKRFLLVYMISGLAAGLAASMFYAKALGASGAIMGMLGTLIVLMPDLRILLFFVIPLPLWAAGIVWALLDIMGVLHPGGIANIAHLVGMAVGLLYGFYLRKKRVKFRRQFSTTQHLTADNVDEYLRSGKI